ncbi:MAG: hypothetical protein M3Y60_07665, partial [Bacteroidota bacterium]|nr:hypothetical protein [Bacteroidota bacterium]
MVVFTLSWAGCMAQGAGLTAPIGFEDSVRIGLENSRSIDGTVVGAGFFSIWPQLGIDQQIAIKRQSSQIRKRKFAMKTHIVNYFGAIFCAVSIEKVDASTLDSYLKLAGRMIEKAPPAQVQQFLASSRAFFQFHSLSYDNTFRLYARDDQYTFDYIENAPSPALGWDDPATATAQPLETDTDTEGAPPTEYGDQVAYDDPPAEEFMPIWMTPAPPPPIEGPVIRFDNITLNFVTAYDSVSLRDSKGTFSLIKNSFVGEGGSFDWTPAGLGPDSVTCNMTTYSFNVRRPELTAE